MDFDRWNLDDENFSATITFGIVLFAATTLFSIVTLPVEYDASNRALAWLENKDAYATGTSRQRTH
jgi:Zn-dependent membrane protease YugP